MFAHDVRLDGPRMDAEAAGDLCAEPQAIEKRPGGEHAVVSREPAGEIRERIRRVGDDKQHRSRRGGDRPRHDVPVRACVHVQQSEPSAGVTPVRRPACLLVDAGRDHDHVGPGQIAVVAGAHIRGGQQRRPVADVGRGPGSAGGDFIHEDDLARACTQQQRHRARGPNGADPDDPDLHGRPLLCVRVPVFAGGSAVIGRVRRQATGDRVLMRLRDARLHRPAVRTHPDTGVTGRRSPRAPAPRRRRFGDGVPRSPCGRGRGESRSRARRSRAPGRDR